MSFQSVVDSDILDYASSLHLNKHPCDGACIAQGVSRPRHHHATLAYREAVYALLRFCSSAVPHICI
jgi:hypothetical protein